MTDIDAGDGDEGTDRVANVERLTFDGVAFTPAELAYAANAAFGGLEIIGLDPGETLDLAAFATVRTMSDLYAQTLRDAGASVFQGPDFPFGGVRLLGLDALALRWEDVRLADAPSPFAPNGAGTGSLWAGDGDDLVTGTAGGDDIRGGAGNDVLLGGAGVDDLEGGDGDDYLDGGDGGDELDGHAGRDVIRGGAGDDWLGGGDGGDFLFGEAGDDLLQGAQGDDVIRGGDGVDAALYLGPREDYRIVWRSATADWLVTDLNAANGDEGADVVSGVEVFRFGALNRRQLGVAMDAAGSADAVDDSPAAPSWTGGRVDAAAGVGDPVVWLWPGDHAQSALAAARGFEIVDAAGAPFDHPDFAVDGARLVVRAGASLTDGSAQTVLVRAVDPASGLKGAAIAIPIRVGAMDAAAAALIVTPTDVAPAMEFAAADAPVATLAAAGGGAASFTLTDAAGAPLAGGPFRIDGATLMRVAGQPLDFETAPTATVHVRATGGGVDGPVTALSLPVGDARETLYLPDGGVTFIDAGVSEEAIHGGDGDDLIIAALYAPPFDWGPAGLFGGLGNDTLIGADAGVGAYGGVVFDGGRGDDSMVGGAAGDEFFVGGGSDTALGGAGDDVFIVYVDLPDPAPGVHRVEGGAGNDYFQLEGAPAVAVGGAGDDQIEIWNVAALPAAPHSRHRIVVEADAGHDQVNGFLPGHDRLDLTGLPGIETLSDLFALAQFTPPQGAVGLSATFSGGAFGSGALTLRVEGGVEALGYDDVILARGPLAESPFGGPGDERVVGTEGNDGLEGGDGDDVMIGLGGRDDLEGRDGDDYIDGGDDGGELDGHDGRDVIRGGVDGEYLGGGGHGDWLFGGGGDDTLAGDDHRYGPAGADVLHGGEGANMFRFHAVVESAPDAADIILDFESGVDTIQLWWRGDAVWIGDAAFSGAARELRFADGALEGDDDADGVADFRVIVFGDAVAGTDVLA